MLFRTLKQMTAHICEIKSTINHSINSVVFYGNMYMQLFVHLARLVQ
jgi:hypothetical protein